MAADIQSGVSYANKDDYQLFLFPNLRFVCRLPASALSMCGSSPNEYAQGKLFGKKALKAGMLFWTKDLIPTSLTKLVAAV